MRLHPYREQHERLLGIMADYEAAGVAVEVQVYLGDLDLTDVLETGDISIDASSSPAWTFSGTVAGRLNLAYRNAPLRVVADVGGVKIDLLHARASLPIQGAEYTTDVIAGSPGMFLDKATLDSRVIYNNRTPQYVIRDAVTRIPYYDRGRILIPEWNNPLINRGLSGAGSGVGAQQSTASAEAFEDEAHPMDILTSVAEEIDIVFFDTALAGFKAIKNPGVGEGLPVAWGYEVGTREVVDTFSEPTFSTPDEQVSRVVVRDKYEDGTYRIYEEWPVHYRNLLYPPAAVSTMYLSVSDVTTEAFKKARQLAFKTANTLGNGLFSGSISVAFNPLLEPFDLIVIKEEHEDDTGRYRRQWQALVEGITHRFGAGVTTELSYTATLLDTERIEARPIIIETRSSGVAATPIAGFVLGVDYIGEWVDAARITGPKWAGEDSTSDWFDDALAPAGLLGTETVGGELLDYIDYLSVEGASYGEDDSEAGEWVEDAYISDPKWSGVDNSGPLIGVDWFDYDYAPLNLLGEDATGEWIDIDI